MKLSKVKYSDLNNKQKEIYNYRKISAILADYGFDCVRLPDDWNKADFLAHHIDGKTMYRIQLKGRFTIGQKYQGSDIMMAFPISERKSPEKKTWYLIRHTELVKLAGKHTKFLKTTSWKTGKKMYSNANPPKELVDALDPYAL